MTFVDVHSCFLGDDDATERAATAQLSNDEVARSLRYKSPTARREFVLSRSLLRHVLAQHLAIPAAQIGLDYNAFGKPVLGGHDGPALEFNLSHSHGRLLIAVCRDCPVGIDIERVTTDVDPNSLAREGLPEADRQLLLAAAETSRLELFFRCWTRWEAYLKACGMGFHDLPRDPSRSAVSGDLVLWQTPDRRPAVVSDLCIDGPFMAAVALGGRSEPFEIRWHPPMAGSSNA